MAKRRRTLWIAVLIGSLSNACAGDDSSTGDGGSAAAGGAAGAGGSTETGGAGANAGGGGGAGGTAGAAGSSGSGGDGGTRDGGSDGAWAAGGARDAATEMLPPREAGEAGRCLDAGTLTVVNSGSAGYSIDGGSLNAPITLCRGSTYTFSINAPGHPFYIRKEMGGAYDSGITGNHQSVGELVFAVPSDAPSTLLYQCDIHEWMVGAIVIVD